MQMGNVKTNEDDGLLKCYEFVIRMYYTESSRIMNIRSCTFITVIEGTKGNLLK